MNTFQNLFRTRLTFRLCLYGSLKRLIDRQRDRYVCRQIYIIQLDIQNIVRYIDMWIDKQIDRWMDRQLDRQIDGQIDRQIDEQIDRQIDEQIDRQKD